MTRLELLLSYPIHRRRDTWMSFGSAQVDSTARVFFRNAIFRLVAAGTPLNGCIIFVNEDYTLPAGFNWLNMQLADPTSLEGEIIDTTSNIISPYFNVVVTQAQFNAIIEDYDPTFVPFQENDATTLLSISEDELNMVLIEAGVPFIKLEELEYSRDQVVNYMIWPAVKEFYRWFPITSVTHHPLTNNSFRIPMPPKPIFTAIEARVIEGVPIAEGGITNPMLFFFDEVLMNVAGGANGGFSTPGYATSRRRGTQPQTNIATTVMERAVRKGITNYSARNRIRISVHEGFVTGYSTLRGNLEVTWGAYSENWDDIPYSRLTEVRDLAKAYVLRNFAMLRMQARSDIPGTLDYTGFITRADELEKRVIELWQSATKAPIVRLQ